MFFSCALLIPFFCLCEYSFGVSHLVRQKADEEFLRTLAKVPTDDESLLKLLNTRAECRNPEQLDRLVAELGSGPFVKREAAAQMLVQLGPMALPSLRKRFADADTELARRAKSCAKTIETERRADWEIPAVRLLAARKPAGSLEALLAFLACANDPDVEEAIYYGLDAIIDKGKPIPDAMMGALENPAAATRAAAACIIGGRGNPDQKAKVRTVMEKDREPYVKLRAAQGFLSARQKAAIPILIGLLREPSVAVSWQAEELLRWSFGEIAPKETIGQASEEERTQCYKAWRKCWEKHAAAYQFNSTQLDSTGPLLVLASGGPRSPSSSWEWRIRLIGSDGFPRYEVTMAARRFPMGFGWLPENRFVTFERTRPPEHVVLVRDLSGQWVEYFTIDIEPDRWRRLANGHWEFMQGDWLVTCNYEGKVIAPKHENKPARVLGAWNQRKEKRLHDGSAIVSSYDNQLTEIGTRLKRIHRDGRVSWETFLELRGADTLVIYSLVGFGFTSAGNVDTPESRVQALKNPSVLVRRYAIESCDKCH